MLKWESIKLQDVYRLYFLERIRQIILPFYFYQQLCNTLLDAYIGNKENYHLFGEDNVGTARQLGSKDKLFHSILFMMLVFPTRWITINIKT